jgi:phosphate transport system permease protein
VLFESLLFFRQGAGQRISVRLAVESADRLARRSDRFLRGLWQVPLFAGTLLISGIAMLVAVPIGLMSALYLSEYATPEISRLRQAGAGNPGRHPDRGLRLLRRPDRRTADPRDRGTASGLHVASESALAAGW